MATLKIHSNSQWSAEHFGNGTPSCVIIYRSYKLSKMVQFFGPPCITVSPRYLQRVFSSAQGIHPALLWWCVDGRTLGDRPPSVSSLPLRPVCLAPSSSSLPSWCWHAWIYCGHLHLAPRAAATFTTECHTIDKSMNEVNVLNRQL